jgi:hypothetical protein
MGRCRGFSVVSRCPRRWARSFAGSPGDVNQLDAVARETLAGLARSAPLLPGADSYAFLDVEPVINRVYGYDKQGGGLRLHPGTGIASTTGDGLDTDRRAGRRRYPPSGARRARPKGAASFLAEASNTARGPGPPVSCWPGWTRRLTASRGCPTATTP